jgi:cellulose synthase/poly-beta-1,6-N-acetylglucosamine synthase-like glycosyltransferase
MSSLWDFFVAASLIYFIGINFIYTILTLLSYMQSALRVRQAKAANFRTLRNSRLTPPISIIMPAHNEEAMIVTSVATALRLDYPEFEIIVVNDGSRDRTLRKLIETFDLAGSKKPYRVTFPTSQIRRIYYSRTYPNLFVIDKENGGKADALNAGLNLSRYRYVCNTDADTMFEREALLRVIRHIVRDPRRTVAIGGQVRIGNGFRVQDGEVVQRRLPSSTLARFQINEYLRTFLANRVGWTTLNAMLLISGAFAVWRRDALIGIGGFNTKMIGEDLEATMRLHRSFRLRGEPYAVASLPDPVCWTEGPEDLRSFYQQRNRWHRVLLQSFWEHREMLLNPRFGTVGMIGMPYYLFIEILGPFMEVFSYFIVFGAYALGYVQPETLLLFLLLSVGYTTFLNIMAVLIDELHYRTYSFIEVQKLMWYGFLDNLGYRQLGMTIRVIATIDWLSQDRGWGNIRRYGYTNVATPSEVKP